MWELDFPILIGEGILSMREWRIDFGLEDAKNTEVDFLLTCTYEMII